MKKILLPAICLFAAANTIQASSAVTGSALFDSGPFGFFGAWTINFTSTDPAFKLASVNFNMSPTSVFLDTTLAAPGALLSADFLPISGGAATGYSSITPNTAGLRNGATAYTLNFNDFGTGESFRYELDVDKCSSQTFTCSTVNGADIAGASVTFNFGAFGQAYSKTVAFTDNTATSRNDFDAIASMSAEVPEPGTWGLVGSTLVGLGLLRRKRQA